MAKALLVKFNEILCEKSAEEIRNDIIEQYKAGGVIVLDQTYKTEVIEFDSVEADGSSPILAEKELFGKVDGHNFYVIRDEYGRIVVSDELMRELIERATGSSPKEV